MSSAEEKKHRQRKKEASHLDLFEEIQNIESLLDSAKRLPGLGAMVDERQLKETLQNVRQAVPPDIKRAEQILAEREELVNQAARDAKSISMAAEDEFSSKVNVSPVVRAAERRAKEILAAAQQQATGILSEAEREAKARRDETRQYVTEVLHGLDTQLNGLGESVRKGVILLEREVGQATNVSS